MQHLGPLPILSSPIAAWIAMAGDWNGVGTIARAASGATQGTSVLVGGLESRVDPAYISWGGCAVQKWTV